jgi:Predicted phosphatases
MAINGSPEKKDEHIRKIMRSKNFRKEETVFIGDANQDKEAAEITGVHFIGVGMNNFSEDTLKLENLIALNDFIQSRLLS